MSLVKAHKRLRVWQEAMALAKTVYAVTENFPGAEKYGLVSQMRRAAAPSNIGEGAARQGNKETIQFYMIARCSLSELDTQIELCESMNMLLPDDYSALSSRLDKVDSLLSGLIRFKKRIE